MKILLVAVNAKYIHSNLAVYNLKAYAQDVPAQIKIMEATINQPQHEILQQIYEENADVVAFSCYIWNIQMVLSLAGELKKILPCDIWMGGPEASYDAQGLLQNQPFVDGIVIGEGEITFREIALAYCDQVRAAKESKAEKHNDTSLDNLLSGIKGIAYRDSEGGIKQTALREYMDMDNIPFVYENVDVFAHKIIYYETSRGCPFSCSYCLSSIDKRVRFRSLPIVFRELSHFLKEQVPQVKFVDRTFNCKHEHAYAIWQYIQEHDNGVTNFHFEVSADLLREEDFQLFEKMRPGLIQLEIGVQSTNDQTITAIHRTMQLSSLKEHVLRVKQYKNIHQHLDLIAGLPYEDITIFQQSFNDVYAMQPDQLQLGFLKVLKGSDMYENREQYGIVYTSYPPYEVLQTKWLSFADVVTLKGVEEMVEVYYNSGQFQHILTYSIPYFKDAYTFYERLWAFYKQQGYDKCKHTRLARYDILREFLLQMQSTEKGQMSTEHMIKQQEIEQNTVTSNMLWDRKKADEYLRYDIYLTEHSKRYPAWTTQDRYAKELLCSLRNPRWRKEQLSQRCYQQIEPVLQRKTDIHVEYLPVTQGGYVLFDYAVRNPLTNAADVYLVECKESTIMEQ